MRVGIMQGTPYPSLLTSLANSKRQVSTGSLSCPSAMASWQSSNEQSVMGTPRALEDSTEIMSSQ